MCLLVVDDDADQRLLIERAFRSAAGDGVTVRGLGSGNDAIRYLAGEGMYADRSAYPFPSFIVTDLNMPNGDGFAVLEFLQANPAWSVVPRIVLTCSADDDDVKTAFFLGATAYHQKPISFLELCRNARTIVRYWTTCHVPPVDESGRILQTDHTGKLGERFALPKAGVQMQSVATSAASAAVR
jgi:CheY-like chemotaxis protein